MIPSLVKGMVWVIRLFSLTVMKCFIFLVLMFSWFLFRFHWFVFTNSFPQITQEYNMMYNVYTEVIHENLYAGIITCVRVASYFALNTLKITSAWSNESCTKTYMDGKLIILETYVYNNLNLSVNKLAVCDG